MVRLVIKIWFLVFSFEEFLIIYIMRRFLVILIVIMKVRIKLLNVIVIIENIVCLNSYRLLIILVVL